MLFEALKARCRKDWQGYIRHRFVRQLADGTLPLECFQHYLKQDYLFLLQFARAYGLAVFKSRTLDEMRQAASGLKAMLETEIGLHVAYCGQWGIDAASLEELPEAQATVAYTRFVLDCGMAGDLLDLHVALAPCIVGYAEIGTWLMQADFTRLEGNPYRSWIEMYADPGYQKVADEEIDLLDRLGAELPSARLDRIAGIFRDATRLEIGFWRMGLTRAD